MAENQSNTTNERRTVMTDKELRELNAHLRFLENEIKTAEGERDRASGHTSGLKEAATDVRRRIEIATPEGGDGSIPPPAWWFESYEGEDHPFSRDTQEVCWHSWVRIARSRGWDPMKPPKKAES